MSKWIGLDNGNFTFVDLGRPAVFLLPLDKLLSGVIMDFVDLESALHSFLLENFGTFTYFTMPSFGVWKNGKQVICYDACRMYEVSFSGKEKITFLGERLAKIAVAINEDCIYFKAGQYAALIYPK